MFQFPAKERVIVVCTDMEPDDLGALLLLQKFCAAYGVKLVVVVCYRSDAILAQAAQDVRVFLPEAEVLRGPSDPERDGGYPMNYFTTEETEPFDLCETIHYYEIVAIVCLSLLDVLDVDRLQMNIGFKPYPPLYVYGGTYNVRTELAKRTLDWWGGIGKLFRFDGYPAFGPRTSLKGDGPYVSELQRMAFHRNAFATRVLQSITTWNAFLANKMARELVDGTDGSKVVHKQRLIDQIRDDPMQGCTADMFVVLMMTAVSDSTELVGRSWRPCVMDSADHSPELKQAMDAVRAQLRLDLENRLVELLRGHFPAEIPFLGLKRIE